MLNNKAARLRTAIPVQDDVRSEGPAVLPFQGGADLVVVRILGGSVAFVIVDLLDE
jgi:hypothetical protein